MTTKKLKTYSLKLEEDFENTWVLGIQTPLTGYRLAYLINKNLSLQLRKNEIDVVFNKKNFETHFSTYDYYNKDKYITWSLIHNVYKSLILDKNPFDLFATESFYSTKIDYLLPEEKAVNFLLKIEGIDTEYYEKIASAIRTIYNVELVKPLDIKTLKNKKNLIF
jgi:hypothetical protein